MNMKGDTMQTIEIINNFCEDHGFNFEASGTDYMISGGGRKLMIYDKVKRTHELIGGRKGKYSGDNLIYLLRREFNVK